MKKLAGEDQHLSKKDFIKHLKTSNFFMKSFDKNKDGVVTEVLGIDLSSLKLNTYQELIWAPNRLIWALKHFNSVLKLNASHLALGNNDILFRLKC